MGDRYPAFLRLQIFETLMRRVGKDRRESADFIGAENVLKQLKDGPPKRRVGLFVEGAPARGMYPISFSALSAYGHCRRDKDFPSF